jgi:hypothetical protein
MIETLKESHGPAFGFKVTDKLTADDIVAITPRIDAAIAAHKHPIGLLADLSAMHGATWAARWEQMRFLQRHTDHIARLAVVSNDTWEEIAEMAAVASAALQAETRYFQSSEIQHAWHWVKLSNHDEAMPVRILYPGRGLFQDYIPLYMEL